MIPKMIPVIFGLKGLQVSAEERSFFQACNPLGFILFARNIETPDQVQALTADLKNIANHDDVLILIDQEGGRVQRLTPPHWHKYPPMNVFGEAIKKDRRKAIDALILNMSLIAADLDRLGINVNCLPVLDVPVAGAHDVIGDRAFSHNPLNVGELGDYAIKALMRNGVLPVVKHIPGHGRAGVDSHKELPRVDATMAELNLSDFKPFQRVKDAPLAMTAHVLYSAIDDKRPATTSSVVIGRIIRMKIGFTGLLMSDDLSMEALDGDFAKRTVDSFQAGCDIALHCNGELREMRDIAGAAPHASKKFIAQLRRYMNMLDIPTHNARAAHEQEFNELMTELGMESYRINTGT